MTDDRSYVYGLRPDIQCKTQKLWRRQKQRLLQERYQHRRSVPNGQLQAPAVKRSRWGGRQVAAVTLHVAAESCTNPPTQKASAGKGPRATKTKFTSPPKPIVRNFQETKRTTSAGVRRLPTTKEAGRSTASPQQNLLITKKAQRYVHSDGLSCIGAVMCKYRVSYTLSMQSMLIYRSVLFKTFHTIHNYCKLYTDAICTCDVSARVLKIT